MCLSFRLQLPITLFCTQPLECRDAHRTIQSDSNLRVQNGTRAKRKVIKWKEKIRKITKAHETVVANRVHWMPKMERTRLLQCTEHIYIVAHWAYCIRATQHLYSVRACICYMCDWEKDDALRAIHCIDTYNMNASSKKNKRFEWQLKLSWSAD